MWFAGAMGTAVGLLLAAGSGSRMGGPKALVRGAGGEPWARAAARSLHEGGCPQVVAVLGAAGGEAEALLADLPWVSVGHVRRPRGRGGRWGHERGPHGQGCRFARLGRLS